MHTPGPWTIRASDGAIVRHADQRTIVAPGGAMLTQDAALAAAAPDLLDALRAVAGDLLDVLSQRMDPKLAEQLPSLESARAIIAKATKEI